MKNNKLFEWAILELEEKTYLAAIKDLKTNGMRKESIAGASRQTIIPRLFTPANAERNKKQLFKNIGYSLEDTKNKIDNGYDISESKINDGIIYLTLYKYGMIETDNKLYEDISNRLEKKYSTKENEEKEIKNDIQDNVNDKEIKELKSLSKSLKDSVSSKNKQIEKLEVANRVLDEKNKKGKEKETELNRIIKELKNEIDLLKAKCNEYEQKAQEEKNIKTLMIAIVSSNDQELDYDRKKHESINLKSFLGMTEEGINGYDKILVDTSGMQAYQIRKVNTMIERHNNITSYKGNNELSKLLKE